MECFGLKRTLKITLFQPPSTRPGCPAHKNSTGTCVSQGLAWHSACSHTQMPLGSPTNGICSLCSLTTTLPFASSSTQARTLGSSLQQDSQELNWGAANPGSFAQPCLPSSRVPAMQISITSTHGPGAPALTHGHCTAHGSTGTTQHNGSSVARRKLFHGFGRRKKKA